MHKILDWLQMNDYEKAKTAATSKIVKRQSRCSIFAQNGWFMSRSELDRKSRAADGAVRVIAKAVSKAR